MSVPDGPCRSWYVVVPVASNGLSSSCETLFEIFILIYYIHFPSVVSNALLISSFVVKLFTPSKSH